LLLGTESMPVMGRNSKTIDRLPAWVQLRFYTFAVLVSIYCIAHYGFWSFVLHTIFGPEI
jgi:hypothetical protein